MSYLKKVNVFLAATKDHSTQHDVYFLMAQFLQGLVGFLWGPMSDFRTDLSCQLCICGLCDLAYTFGCAHLYWTGVTRNRTPLMKHATYAWTLSVYFSFVPLLLLSDAWPRSPMFRMYLWSFVIRWFSTFACIHAILATDDRRPFWKQG